MSKIAVQIYEIQDPLEVEALVELGVDRVGSVIFSEENWRVPTIKDAILISRENHVKHSLIPLFNTKEILFRVVDYYKPDVVHFCEALTRCDGSMLPYEGHVALQMCIKERFPEIELMRTLPIHSPRRSKTVPTLEIAKRFETASDCFLTDTWVEEEPVQGHIGITGLACDWTVARKLVELSKIPVILAGGLSPENVYDAMMAVKPFGADSCTKTNAVDGNGKPVRFKKDYEKVNAFVTEVRRAERDLFKPHKEDT